MKPTGLTINQYSLLINLDAIAPCTTTQLAQKMYLDRTTLTRNMKPLEKEGFIKNTAQPSQRNKKLILTEKGKSILKKQNLSGIAFNVILKCILEKRI